MTEQNESRHNISRVKKISVKNQHIPDFHRFEALVFDEDQVNHSSSIVISIFNWNQIKSIISMPNRLYMIFY